MSSAVLEASTARTFMSPVTRTSMVPGAVKAEPTYTQVVPPSGETSRVTEPVVKVPDTMKTASATLSPWSITAKAVPLALAVWFEKRVIIGVVRFLFVVV